MKNMFWFTIRQNPIAFLRPQDALEGEAIVPGFSMSVAELFEEWDF
jgi:hypothetical protein